MGERSGLRAMTSMAHHFASKKALRESPNDSRQKARAPDAVKAEGEDTSEAGDE